MTLYPLERDDLKTILLRAVKDREQGLGEIEIEIMPQALEHIIDISSGDARVALGNLEIAVSYAMDGQNGTATLTLKTVEIALNRKALIYDKDGEEHYNLISALHKSMRGSDPQASLYWLYRMLLAGEDPLFIARRMIRFASEDIGLADPNALQVAIVAFDAWQKIGPPEAELALAQAAVYLATAPKSNALYIAEKTVKKEIEDSGVQSVPLHLRNAPTTLMKKLGYSRGYRYPHNYPDGWVKQAYLPDNMKTRFFYRPTGRGFEKEIRKRMADFRDKEKR
jgi:putative ATPase